MKKFLAVVKNVQADCGWYISSTYTHQKNFICRNKKKTLDKKTCKKKNINCHKFGKNYESKFESVSSTAGGELGSLI